MNFSMEMYVTDIIIQLLRKNINIFFHQFINSNLFN